MNPLNPQLSTTYYSRIIKRNQKKQLLNKVKYLFFILIFLFTNNLQAQADGVGTFVNDSKISLKYNGTVIPYQFNFDLMQSMNSNFLEGIDPMEYCTLINSEISTMLYDAEENTIELSIEKRMKPEWTVMDWEDYIILMHIDAVEQLK